jgi:glycosyltransferase involved in cell wall biosynthesis
LITFTHEAATTSGPSELSQLCATLEKFPYRSYEQAAISTYRDLLSTTPKSLKQTFNRRLHQAVIERLHASNIDLVIGSQLDMLPYVSDIVKCPVIFEELELGTYQDKISTPGWTYGKIRSFMTWVKLRNYLTATSLNISAYTTVSEHEKNIAETVLPRGKSITVIPNAILLSDYVDTESRIDAPDNDVLVYAGSITYSHNYDAVRFFTERILPVIRQTRPNMRLIVTGETGGLHDERLFRQHEVEFTGHVDDIHPIVRRAWASVVPLQGGGGTRLKILESMALGTPVIATSKGCEGLQVSHGETILVGDTPEAFASAVIDLTASPTLRASLVRAARSLLASTYNWDLVGAEFSRLVDQCATGRRSAVLTAP